MTNFEMSDYLKDAISLEAIGSDEFGFFKSQCLDFILFLEKSLTPILGGDVYIKKNGQIEPAHENWYIERLENEDYNLYVKRSCAISRDYVKNFPLQDGESPVFVVVFRR